MLLLALRTQLVVVQLVCILLIVVLLVGEVPFRLRATVGAPLRAS